MVQGSDPPSVDPSDCHLPVPGEDLIQSAQQIREVAVGRFRCRSLEGAAQRGHDSGMRRRGVDHDQPPIHAVNLFRRLDFMFGLHAPEKTTTRAGSFVAVRFAACPAR